MKTTTASRYDLIVFDFDGTLCDSVEIKNQAFFHLYIDRGTDFAQRVLAHHLSNIGISRYEKIRYIESEMLGAVPSAEQIEAMATRLGSLVESRVISIPLFEGVADYLDSAENPIALASATPVDELRRIVKAKGIADKFVGIYGSPNSKSEIIAELVARFSDTAGRVLVVGDQESDRNAAHSTGADFVAIRSNGDRPKWVSPYPIFESFSSFAAMHRV